MDRPIFTVQLPKNVIVQLTGLNILSCKDIDSNNTDEIETLLRDTTFRNAWSKSLCVPDTKNALYYLEKEAKDNIVSFSKGIDNLLGGGFKLGKLAELIGPPGSGKTQLCLQLCVAVKVPKLLGGLDASCIFIDANNNYSQKRINEMHLSSIRHCHKVFKRLSLTEGHRRRLEMYTQSSPDTNLYKYVVNSFIELKSCLCQIRKTLRCEESSNVKLIVVDSFASVFYTIANLQRTKILSSIMHLLTQITVKYNIAIILTNSLVTRHKNDNEFELVPHLGENFAHLTHKRIMLNRCKETGHHTATLIKSAEDKPNTVNFKVITDGIRDL